jgi:hypothetical protein
MKPPKNRFLAILGILVSISVSSQTSILPDYSRSFTPSISTIHYKLGETTIPIRIYQYGDVKDLICINLHDDEQSSVEAARTFLQEEGGMLIKFENRKQRNIKFRLRGKYYTFDPNRMFSKDGIEQTLTHFRRSSKDAIKEIEKFGQRVLNLIPENPSCVIALHNNTPGRFGVNSYLPGADFSMNAKKVYENPKEDPDDIFFTTDSILFRRLSSEKFNTIWQDNSRARRDGSLSVYCGERNIRYVNCETEHGKAGQYYTMLSAMNVYIERVSPEAMVFNYRLQNNTPIRIAEDEDIFFGEQKVGKIRSVFQDDSLTISGRLEINRRFRLFSNSDLYLLQMSGRRQRIEIRMDPTREKNLLSSGTHVLPIIVKNLPASEPMVDNSATNK